MAISRGFTIDSFLGYQLSLDLGTFSELKPGTKVLILWGKFRGEIGKIKDYRFSPESGDFYWISVCRKRIFLKRNEFVMAD